MYPIHKKRRRIIQERKGIKEKRGKIKKVDGIEPGCGFSWHKH